LGWGKRKVIFSALLSLKKDFFVELFEKKHSHCGWWGGGGVCVLGVVVVVLPLVGCVSFLPFLPSLPGSPG